MKVTGLFKLAAAYVRMSSDDQEESIPIQKERITKWAAEHGFVIVRWYEDEAKSGDDENRDQLVALLDDAKRTAEFGTIICLKQQRLSRMEPTAFFHHLYLIKKAGLQLVSVKEGLVDGNTIDGGIRAFVQAHRDHDDLFEISEKCTYGRLKKAKSGSILAHKTYGLTFTLRAGSKLRRPEYDAAINETEAEIVREMYTRILDGWSLGAIAKDLNVRDVPTPRGGSMWSAKTIKKMLQNKSYIGTQVYFARTSGKRMVVMDDKVVPVDHSGPRQKNPNPVEVPNVYPAIVSPETYWSAQKKINLERSVKGREYVYPLSGILRCECGQAMYGYCKNRPGHKDKVKLYYRCKNAAHSSVAAKTLPMDSHCRALVRCDEIETAVIQKLLMDSFTTDMVEQRMEVMRDFLRERSAGAVERCTRKKAKLAKIEGAITVLEERLAILPPDMLAPIISKIREHREERSKLSTEIALDATAAAASEEAIATKIRKIKDRIETYRQHLIRGDLNRVTLRQAMACIFDHIDVTVDRVRMEKTANRKRGFGYYRGTSGRFTTAIKKAVLHFKRELFCPKEVVTPTKDAQVELVAALDTDKHLFYIVEEIELFYDAV